MVSMKGRKSRTLAGVGYQRKLRRIFRSLESYTDMFLSEGGDGILFNIKPISIMSKTDFFEIASMLESKSAI